MHPLQSIMERIVLYRSSRTGSEPGLLIYNEGLRILENFRPDNPDQEEARNLLRTWMNLWWGRARHTDVQARLAAWRANHEAISAFVLRAKSVETETLSD